MRLLVRGLAVAGGDWRGLIRLRLPRGTQEVSLAVAANWLLSELIPSLAVSLALSRHVTRYTVNLHVDLLAPHLPEKCTSRRLCREAPVGQGTRNGQSYTKIGGSGADTGDVPGACGGVFRQGSELLPFR